jgi:hypothetical protein
MRAARRVPSGALLQNAAAPPFSRFGRTSHVSASFDYEIPPRDALLTNKDFSFGRELYERIGCDTNIEQSVFQAISTCRKREPRRRYFAWG